MKRNIFCIEGEWDNNPGHKMSVIKALEFFEVIEKVKTYPRDCSTIEELKSRMKEYGKKIFDDYGICYFACHGTRRGIQLKNRITLTLAELAEIIGPTTLKNKIIHFGCCKTLAAKKDATEFKKTTNALAVCGYTRVVGFTNSTMFDILLFNMMQSKTLKTKRYISPNQINKNMQTYCNGLVNELGFVMF